MSDGTEPVPPKFYSYEAGLDVVAEAGFYRPFGRRILARGIMGTDGYTGPITLVVHNSTDYDAFEVIALGGGVEKWCAENNEKPPEVGQHIDARSVAADRVAQKDPTGRYWVIDVADLTGVFPRVEADHPKIVEAVKLRAERKANMRAVTPDNGEIELVAGR